MKATRLFILILFLCFVPNISYAKVIFDWSDIKATSQQKDRVVQIFGKVASMYTNPGYCNLGPLDFFSVDEEYFIRWDPELKERESENWGQILALSFDLLEKPNALEELFSHELVHLYDRTMADRLFHPVSFRQFPQKYRPKITYSQVNKWIHDFHYRGELRAVGKEIEYLKGMKTRMEGAEYDRSMRHVLEIKRILEKD